MLGRRIAGFVAGAASLLSVALLCATVSAPTTAGCATHQCDATFQCVFPHGPAPAGCTFNTEAVTLTDDQVYRDGDEFVWYSGPLSGDWLDFHGFETLSIFYPPAIAAALAAKGPGAVPTSVTAWLSSDAADAASPTRNFVNGAGQLAEYVSMDNHAVNVFNSTCANTSLRIEVRAAVGPDEDADTMASPSSDASLDGAQSRSDGPSMTEQDGRTGGLVVPDAMSDAGPE